jgi:ribonuclease HII
MKRAIEAMPIRPDCLLVDGIFTVPYLSCFQQAIKKGDQKSFSIACASILAKVTRDRIMDEYDTMYPEYHFARNRGYPTKAHRDAISRLGPSPIHRLTFHGVREFVRE